MDEIVWKEPPATATLSGAKTGRYMAFARALREKPGEWAVLPGERTAKTAANLAQNLRRGNVNGFENAEWETAIDGSEIYIRFIKVVPKSVVEPQKDKEDDDTVAETESGPLIRAWGRSNGWPELPVHGRLPRKLVEAYHARTPTLQPVS